MESIKKLRRVANEWCTSVVSELVSVYTGDYVRSESVSDVQVANALRNAIKEIEQEFKELDDGELAEMGLMRLPLDANGVPVRVGDVMEWADGDTFEVVGIGGEMLFYTENGGIKWTSVKCRPHHYEPTVEDVIAEIADKAANLTGSYKEGGMSGDEYTVAMQLLTKEFAAKLRLAGDAE